MSQKTLFIRDKTYTDADLADLFQAIIKGGVYAENQGLQVIVPGDGTNGTSVFVCAGRAWIKGRYFQSDTTEILPIDAADGVLNRKDVVVLEYAPNTDITIKVIKGTAASGATAPDITQTDDCYQLKLAEISVDAGITKITADMITDYRYDESVCGLVTGMLQSIDISQFLTQANAEFASWFAEMKGQLSTDAAGNLQKQIDNNTWKLSGGTPIPPGADLYNYTTVGNYCCDTYVDTLTLLHRPAGLSTAFIMQVYLGTGDSCPTQEIRPLGTSIVYKQYYDNYNKKWVDCGRVATNADIAAINTPNWQTVTLTTGLTPVDTPRVFKAPDGRVTVDIRFTVAAAPSDCLICVLPYLPTHRWQIPVAIEATGKIELAIIYEDGRIVVTGGTPSLPVGATATVQGSYYYN